MKNISKTVMILSSVIFLASSNQLIAQNNNTDEDKDEDEAAYTVYVYPKKESKRESCGNITVKFQFNHNVEINPSQNPTAQDELALLGCRIALEGYQKAMATFLSVHKETLNTVLDGQDDTRFQTRLNDAIDTFNRDCGNFISSDTLDDAFDSLNTYWQH